MVPSARVSLGLLLVLAFAPRAALGQRSPRHRIVTPRTPPWTSPRPRRRAPPPQPSTPGTPIPARHALYAELISSIALNGLGVNYAYRVTRGFALSVGLGGAYQPRRWVLFGETPTVFAGGATVMLHGLVGGRANYFEFAGGVSVMYAASDQEPSLWREDEDGVAVWPAVFIGYRHHPLEGGPVIRVGFSLAYRAVGVGFSSGGAF